MTEGGPDSKRRKSSPDLSQSNATAPYQEVDPYGDGDVVLSIPRMADKSKHIACKCSSQVLSLASPVLKRLLAQDEATSSSPGGKALQVEEDQDVMLLLLHVLHFNNTLLPWRMGPELLLRYITLAAKYECRTAASRAAFPWFDHIYHNVSTTTPLLKMIEAAYVLNDPIWFSRFTSRWVLTQPLGQSLDALSFGAGPARRRIVAELLTRQKDAINALKADLDILIDPLSTSLSAEAEHYIDCEPGIDPHPDELKDGKQPVQCVVDKEGATEFLSALRDADIWPATRWSNSIQSTISSIVNFRPPDYDASDQCFWCSHVEDKFATALDLVRQMHKERLWGLCLDCYQAGGLNMEACRWEHVKPQNLSASVVARQLSGAAAASKERKVS